jgi:hypothetical protein
MAGRPGLHWPNRTTADESARNRLGMGKFPTAVVLTNLEPAEARWVAMQAGRVFYRIYWPLGELPVAMELVETAGRFIEQVDPAGWYQLLNEPDVEYPTRAPEQLAAWWDLAAGFLLRRYPQLRLGFPAPSVAGPADYLPRVAAAGGLRRASWIGEHCYWQPAWEMALAQRGQRWQRSTPYRLPIVVTEFGCSDPATPKSVKAQMYLDWAASLPRAVTPAGAFIGAGGDPAFDTPAEGCLWIDDAMAAAIGAGKGVRTVSGEAVRRYAALILAGARMAQVRPSVVAGLIDVESGGNPDATSADNGPGLGHALGLMQVLEGHFAPGQDGHDPATNIAVGCQVLRAKLDTFGGRLESGLAAYFGAVDAAGNPTDGKDLTGTTGKEYVAEVLGAAASFTDLDPLVGAVADPDFRQYAPGTGTWREAAVNLKGIADDALAAGRKVRGIVEQAGQDAAAAWGTR